VEQLTGMQDDMKNLLEATSLGTVFLDARLRIKRFTREACHVYRLAPADVGRPLGDIKSNLAGHDLLVEAQAVLETLVPVEREVHTADGTWFLARLLPYRTMDDAIRGVVLTFTNITTRVAAEAEARAERELASRIVDTVREPLLVLDGKLRVVSASRAFHETFGTTPETTTGRLVYELAERRWDLPALRELLERVLPRDQAFDRFEVDAAATDGGARKVYLTGRRIVAGPPRSWPGAASATRWSRPSRRSGSAPRPGRWCGRWPAERRSRRPTSRPGPTSTAPRATARGTTSTSRSARPTRRPATAAAGPAWWRRSTGPGPSWPARASRRRAWRRCAGWST